MRKPMVAVVRVRHRRYALLSPPGRLVVIFHAHPLSSKPPAAQRLCLGQGWHRPQRRGQRAAGRSGGLSVPHSDAEGGCAMSLRKG